MTKLSNQIIESYCNIFLNRVMYKMIIPSRKISKDIPSISFWFVNNIKSVYITNVVVM